MELKQLMKMRQREIKLLNRRRSESPSSLWGVLLFFSPQEAEDEALQAFPSEQRTQSNGELQEHHDHERREHEPERHPGPQRHRKSLSTQSSALHSHFTPCVHQVGHMELWVLSVRGLHWVGGKNFLLHPVQCTRCLLEVAVLSSALDRVQRTVVILCSALDRVQRSDSNRLPVWSGVH